MTTQPSTDNTLNAEQPKKEKRPKRARAWELDALRGLAILLVALDHTMFNLAYMFRDAWLSSGAEGLIRAVEVANSYMSWDVRLVAKPLFVGLFFVVSGICTTFSRNNLVRGLKLGTVALLLTGLTYLGAHVFGDDSIIILFGVLHCLASCILLYAGVSFLVRLLAKKHTKIVSLVVYLALAITIFAVYYSLFPATSDATLSTISQSDSWFVGIWVYARSLWYSTADYFPILPFFGFFLVGSALGVLLYPNKKSLAPKLDGVWMRPFTIPGKYSLIVYLGSQGLCLAILALITYVKTGALF